MRAVSAARHCQPAKRRQRQRRDEADPGAPGDALVGGGDRLGVGEAALLLLALMVAPRRGGGARRGDEIARRLGSLGAVALDVALGAVEQRGGNVEMARLVFARRLRPFARDRLQRVAHANEVGGLGNDRHRLGPDAQQRLVRRAHALARGVAFGGEKALGDEGFDERRALGTPLLEAGAIERADHRRRRAGQRIGGDVAHQPRDQVRQLPARGRLEAGERLVGGFRHRLVHAAIIGEAQQAVAARRLRRAEARKRHLQQRQRVAAARVGDQLRSERASVLLLEGERRIA